MLTAAILLDIVLVRHQMYVTVVIKQITTTRQIRITRHQKFQRLANNVIQQQHGSRQHLIMRQLRSR